MNVLVTGGTPVLGQPVVRRLIERGHLVRGLVHSEEGRRVLEQLVARRATHHDIAELHRGPFATSGDRATEMTGQAIESRQQIAEAALRGAARVLPGFVSATAAGPPGSGRGLRAFGSE